MGGGVWTRSAKQCQRALHRKTECITAMARSGPSDRNCLSPIEGKIGRRRCKKGCRRDLLQGLHEPPQPALWYQALRRFRDGSKPTVEPNARHPLTPHIPELGSERCGHAVEKGRAHTRHAFTTHAVRSRRTFAF